MVAQQHRLDAIANNLANVDQNGYKRDVSIHKAFPELLIRRTSDNGVIRFPLGSIDAAPIVGKLGTGVEQNEVFTNFAQGALKETTNPFDLALEGEGFFVVDTANGERFTRNGAFLINDDSILVTKEGLPVLGENGPIQIKKNNFVIDEQGNVYVNASLDSDKSRLVALEENEWEAVELIDKLRVVEFRRPRFLEKQGDSLWTDTEESGTARANAGLGSNGLPTKVRQGFVEGSNVNPVREMVEMIEVQRAYETNSRLIQTQDELLGRLINESRGG
jgi:flagellar basal-body rod protein FlgG